MPKFTTIEDYHSKLMAEVFDTSLSDSDALLVMTLLHTYRIVLPGTTLLDRAATAIEPITQRDAASALARIWRGSQDERRDCIYWYWRWNHDWGSYPHLEAITAQERVRLRELKERIEEHWAVERLDPDDWDLLTTNTAV